MPATTQTPQTPTIRLNVDRVRAEARRRGWITDLQIAQSVGVSKGNLSRLFREEDPQVPGPVFIAALMTAFPMHAFEDFFDIVRPSLVQRRAS